MLCPSVKGRIVPEYLSVSSSISTRTDQFKPSWSRNVGRANMTLPTAAKTTSSDSGHSSAHTKTGMSSDDWILCHEGGLNKCEEEVQDLLIY